MNAPLQVRTCERCAAQWGSVHDTQPCSDCRSEDFYEKFTPEDREAVEAFIYDRKTLAAIMEMRSRMDLSLADATFLSAWWEERLQTQHPERFRKDDDHAAE